MLYPNYDGFVSLSTNHLEVGSHVKDVSKEKQDLFLLPLMDLPGDGHSPVRLMDLPDHRLPVWDALPVLNLTGSLSTLQELKSLGEQRRMTLTMCPVPSKINYDVMDLMFCDRTSFLE